MTVKLLLAGVTVAGLISATVQAQVVQIGAGTGFGIGDATNLGLDTSDPSDGVDDVLYNFSQFEVLPGSPQDVSIGSLSLTLTDFSHSYLADLDVYLAFLPAGGDPIVDQLIFSLVDPSNLGGSYASLDGTYTFADGGASFWAAAADAEMNFAPIAPGTYQAVDGLGQPLSLDDAFGGLTTAGTWELAVYDFFPTSDTGALAGWSVAVAVPEPSSLAGLLLAGGGLVRRRR